MNKITQEAKKRQGAVLWGIRHGKSDAARKYGVSLTSIKRWSRRYDGTWQSLREKSHRPHRSPRQHSAAEEELLRAVFLEKYLRYGWDGVYTEAQKQGYKRSLSGMVYALRRMGLGTKEKEKKPPRKNERRYPELEEPGDKVQVDVKEVPYCSLKGKIKADGKHLYQWTGIDECTRVRFVYGFEEHTPENTVKFLKMMRQAFPFEVKKIQTDNGTEFTYKFISDTELSPMDKYLSKEQIEHVLIPPRTPWHNGKVERSHRNDQRYFYDWEKFGSVDELNEKLADYLIWSNNKPMRTLGGKTPVEFLEQKMQKSTAPASSQG